MSTITISQRFCGPPTSGNGGYSCGLLVQQTDYLAEVTLRRPIPLDSSLRVEHDPPQLRLWEGEELIAEARPGELELDVPAPPSLDLATEAAQGYIGLKEEQAFPTCFVCGPDRAAGDGLRIFAGQVGDSQLYASPWTPASDLAGEDGQVKDEFIWAALDCPGAYAAMADEKKIVVLGRFIARIDQSIPVGEPVIVTAWRIEGEGRKHICGTALFNGQQDLCAVAKATWIELNQA